MIRSIKGKSAEVQVGDMLMRAKIDQLFLASETKVKTETKKISTTFNSTQKRANFNTELNIRGMRAEIAITEIDKFLDEALLAGVTEVRILHGKGEGVLRNIARDLLRKYKHVETYFDEHADRGGAGITIAILK